MASKTPKALKIVPETYAVYASLVGHTAYSAVAVNELFLVIDPELLVDYAYFDEYEFRARYVFTEKPSKIGLTEVKRLVNEE